MMVIFLQFVTDEILEYNYQFILAIILGIGYA